MVLYVSLIIEYLHIVFIQKKKYPFFDAMTSVFIKNFRRYFIKGLQLLGYYDLSYWAFKLRIFELPKLQAIHYIMLFIIIDFGYYWAHRAGHQLRFFWIPHSVHHLPKQIMIIRSSQQSISGLFLTPIYFMSVPLALLGLPPAVFWPLYFLNSSYQELLHNEFSPKLGPLEWIFNTPAQHRIHHSVKPEHIDKNFGGVFSIWDRMFGTFHLDDCKIEIYGTIPLVENKTIFTPLVYEAKEFKKLFSDFRHTPGFFNKFGVFFESPTHHYHKRSQKLAAARPETVDVTEEALHAT